MRLSDCKVRAFMKCLYDKDFTDISPEDFEQVYTGYIDLSGIGESREYELLTAIHNLHTRIAAMGAFMDLQRNFFKEFAIPFVDAFTDMKKYGHRLTWTGDAADFERQLKMTETREKSFIAELDTRIKELKTLKSGETKTTPGDSRHGFVRLLNNLGREGYRIDRDQTDMEELALMAKDYYQSLRSRAAAQSKKQFS